MPKPIKSKLASVIRQMLDDTGMFTREEWATILGISPSAISQWVNDKTLPRAQTLYTLFSVIRDSKKEVAKRAVSEFERVAKLPAMQVTPHANRLGGTLREYLLESMKEVFAMLLDELSIADQEKVLISAASHCRELSCDTPELVFP